MTGAGTAAVRGGVSACVIARDDETTIEACLQSLEWVDECVVVLDERSRDETEQKARAAGARVVIHPYEGNIEQKNFALEQLKGDVEWVLSLDADEVLSPQLATRMRDWIAHASVDFAAAELNRVTHYLGHWHRHGDFYPDWQLRVFRRGRGRFDGVNPHGRVEVEGARARLAGDLEHYSYTDLADQIERVQSYSAVAAAALHERGRRVRISDIVLRPPARFLRAYILKRGFLDGFPGFVVAVVTAFHVFLKYAKLSELELAGEFDSCAEARDFPPRTLLARLSHLPGRKST